MSVIVSIEAREIIDSRGYPTVEADVLLEDGSLGRACVPSGASTGSHEAVEKRDGGARYCGRGVTQAVLACRGEIFEALGGMEADNQGHIDETLITLDGTPNKSRLGANAMLAVSLATAKAAAVFHGVPLFRYLGGTRARVLPVPMMNLINGGAHANNPLAWQEFMILPLSANNFATALRMGAEVFHALKQSLADAGHPTSTGDEGGFAPNFTTPQEAIEALMHAIEKAGYRPKDDIAIALDVASNELYKKGLYHFGGDSKPHDGESLIKVYEDIVTRYPVVSIEDPMAEDDWEGWAMLTRALGDKVQIVGDDIFVTTMARLLRGIKEKSANAILVKVNQAGTLSEALDVVARAQNEGLATVMSHRSGETEDVTIADLSVAYNCGQIKTGSLARSERTAKYNQLLRIEEILGEQSCYAGKQAFKFLF